MTGASRGRGIRVALLTQWFPPEPAQQPLWIAQGLRDQGLHVRVVTGQPNYPDGQVLPGYRAAARGRERIDGFVVDRVPLYPSHGRSAVRRAANYLSFAASSSAFAWRTLASADVVLVYSSPATAAQAAWMVRALGSTPYVLLIQDVWPDSIFASGFLPGGAASRVVAAALDRACATWYRKAAHIVVISPGMIDLLVARGVPREKVSLVYNWVDEELFKPVEPARGFREGLGVGDGLLVTYAGNIGSAQGLESVIDVMSLLRGRRDIHLALVGEGVARESLVTRAGSLGLDRVHFVRPVSADRIASYMAASDVMLVSLADDPLFAVTTPSKLQSAMAVGRPVVAYASGDVAEVVMESGSGWAVNPSDKSGLATTLVSIRSTAQSDLTRLGLKAAAAYREQMGRGVGAQRLAVLLKSASDGAGATSRGVMRSVDGVQ